MESSFSDRRIVKITIFWGGSTFLGGVVFGFEFLCSFGIFSLMFGFVAF